MAHDGSKECDNDPDTDTQADPAADSTEESAPGSRVRSALPLHAGRRIRSRVRRGGSTPAALAAIQGVAYGCGDIGQGIVNIAAALAQIGDDLLSKLRPLLIIEQASSFRRDDHVHMPAFSDDHDVDASDFGSAGAFGDELREVHSSGDSLKGFDINLLAMMLLRDIFNDGIGFLFRIGGEKIAFIPDTRSRQRFAGGCHERQSCAEQYDPEG
jgi:hypothetical protein